MEARRGRDIDVPPISTEKRHFADSVRRAREGLKAASLPRSKKPEGDYSARFTGTGWIVSGEDDGTYISDTPKPDTFGLNFEQMLKIGTPGGQLGIDGLFPRNWQGSQIKYEIVVTAKRLAPTKRRFPY